MCRHCAQPHVVVGSIQRKARPQRRESALSPMYSLSRSRTMLRRPPPRPALSSVRLSSGPIGMHTEHLAWAPRPGQASMKEGRQPEPSLVPILTYAE